ncbi:MAG TPA: HEAT repeat domain-containing protein [Pyrinomonadaceae bacterium]|nr:HEAT repeat domain-containing protein [Pyrinomonadaceae bacterium]
MRALVAFCAVVFFFAVPDGAGYLNASARVSVSPLLLLQQSAPTPLQRRIEIERARLSSSDTEERREAVQRLGAMARPESSRAASVALRDASPVVRATAARAVLSLGSNDAATLLVPLLRDKDEFVRREAAFALGLTRSQTATHALAVALVGDKEASVRGAAAVALGQIADPASVPVLSETLGRRIRASGLFARILRRRTEEDEFVRRSAAVALGRIGSREGVPALVAVLGNERAGDDVRREAARALGLIGDPSAMPALRAVLTARDPHLSRIAFDALRRLDPASVARPA